MRPLRFFSRKLHRQIYLTIAGSLVLVVVLSGVVWDGFGRDNSDRSLFRVAERLAVFMLPPADAPRADQARAARRLGQALEFDVGLFAADGALIGGVGDTPRPDRRNRSSRWRGSERGPGWTLRLPDGRVLMLEFGQRGPRRPFLTFLLFVVVVAGAVALGAYPLSRRLTRRVERLRLGVEKVGGGDLSARVEVEGRDEIAALAESFNHAAGEIERLVAARRLLLAHASHELRTPLARIRMGLEMLKPDEDAAGEDARRTELKRDIDELDDLIDEILLTTRLDASVGSGAGPGGGSGGGPGGGGRLDAATLAEVDLTALAAEECARYRGCDLSGAAPLVTGDATLLRRMIRNLIDNAFTHGAAPVEVTLSTSRSVATGGLAAVLIVADSGAGVAEGEREKAFEPFFRSADRQNVRGYGLGLPLVRQIAEAHGGGARILPETTGGAVVEVTLPAREL